MKKFLLYTLLLIFAFVAALPTLLSTGWVRDRILSAVDLPEHFTFDSISLSWFSGQELHGLEVKAPDDYGPLTLRAPTITVDMTLWNFLKTRTLIDSFTFQADQLTFERPGVSPLTTTDNTLKVDVHALSHEQVFLTLNLDGALAASNSSGTFHVVTSYDSVTDSFSAKVDAKKLPFLTLLDFHYATPKERTKAAALIGESTDLEATFRSLSPHKVALSFHYTSDYSEGNLKGFLENGVLTLDQDATLSLTVNPLLSREILKTFNPLLVSALRSEKPVLLTINAEGTRIPLLPLNAAETDVSLAVLDPGRIILKDEGLASTLLQFLGGRSSNREIAAWFTPQRMRIQQGVVEVERMDLLLADQFHLALWGTVDIPQDNLRLYLGISTETLIRAFSLQTPRQMMTVAISGTLSNPKVDTKRLLVDIGAMTLLPENPNTTAIPPPTTQPFPWESELTQQERTITPVKTIKDVGTQIFKGLLRR